MVGGAVQEHKATPMSNGLVLIVGGNDTTEAQVYDPVSQLFTAVGPMTTARSFLTAIPLKGSVLITGGSDQPCSGVLRSCTQQWASAELYTVPMITVSISPSSLSFGSQLVGTSSNPQQVAITNTGNTSVAFSNFSTNGDFTIQTNQCQSPLPAGNSCNLFVVFAPIALGSRAGTLNITDNAANSPQTISLSGAGTTTTTTKLTSSLNPSKYGQSFTLTATVVPGVSGIPTGTVAFYDGTTSIGLVALANGAASLATSSLSGGSHSMTAHYSGDATFGLSTSAPLAHVVSKTAPVVTLTSSLNPSHVGQQVTFLATVTGSLATPSGTVTFKEGTKALGTVNLVNGQARFSKTYTVAAGYLIVANYSGDQNYLSKTSGLALKQVVQQYSTNTTLTSSLNPSKQGQPVTLKAAVASSAPGGATGTVTFKNGSTTLGAAQLSSGKAALTTTKLPVGTLTLTANYAGDAQSAKSSGTTKQVVKP